MHDYQESVTTGQTDTRTDARQDDPNVSLCFAGDTKTGSYLVEVATWRAALSSDNSYQLLRNGWTEFDETWQEASTKSPLPFLCFFADQKTKMATLASDLLRLFTFSATAERNLTKLYRKQVLNVLYYVCVVQANLKTKMSDQVFDWLSYFGCFLCNHWMEFEDTWHEAYTQYPLPTLEFDET